MRRYISYFSFFVILISSLFVGCADDTDKYDAVTDGSTWEIISTSELKVPGAVLAVGTGSAIVGADNEYIYKTTNSGLGWSSQILTPSSVRSAFDLYKAGNRIIMCGEMGMIYASTDNGATWTNTSTPQLTTARADLYDIIYPADLSNNPLFISGEKGYLMKSTNQGASWNYCPLNICRRYTNFPVVDTLGDTTWVDTTICMNQAVINFSGGFARNANIVYVLGDSLNTDSEFYIFRSTNGGANWRMIKVALSGYFKDCYMNTDTSGFIIGRSGAIYNIVVRETTATTTYITALGSGYDLNEMEFIDANTGWVVGDGGAIAKTTNAGVNWRRMDIDITGSINDVSFYSATEGWVVGNDASRGTAAIKYTSDGGNTWKFRSYGLGLSLSAVHFVSPTEGWIVGKSGRIAHTTDGGNMWIHQDANTSRTFQDVFFTDNQRGWAVGFSTNTPIDTFMTILYTTDGGEHWTALDGVRGQRLNKVHFVNNQTGWAIGNNGLIIRTSDGGLTWTTQNSNTTAELFGLSVIDANKAFVVGQYGTIIRTTDAGATWTQQNSGTNQTLTGVSFVNATTGYACGSLGTVLKTTDGGANWRALTLPRHSSSVFKTIAFVNSEVGWIAGTFGYILHTCDGGETWYRQLEGFSEDALNDIHILDARHAWIVGDNSVFLKLIPGN